MAPLSHRERQLAEQVAQLQEAIRQMRAALCNRPPLTRVLGVHLSPTEAEVLGFLIARRGAVARRSAVMDWLYSDTPDEPEERIVDVVICRLRRKLRPHGVEIVTTHSVGWHLTPASLAILHQEPEEAAVA